MYFVVSSVKYYFKYVQIKYYITFNEMQEFSKYMETVVAYSYRNYNCAIKTFLNRIVNISLFPE